MLIPPPLEYYLYCEKQMMRWDDEGTPEAEKLADEMRDQMDFLWLHHLSKDEKQYLNKRKI